MIKRPVEKKEVKLTPQLILGLVIALIVIGCLMYLMGGVILLVLVGGLFGALLLPFTSNLWVIVMSWEMFNRRK